MNKETALPLAVMKEDQLDAAYLMSPKGFNKSLEQGVLWINHPGNNRILPMEGDVSFLSLEACEGYYLARVSKDTPLPTPAAHGAEVDLEDHSEVEQGEAAAAPEILTSLEQTIAQRHRDMPEGSYTTHLFSKGIEKIKKKTGEEAIELMLADKTQDLLYESADLIYHLMVLWEASGISLQDVLGELKRRDQ